jgi:hypothetical protein
MLPAFVIAILCATAVTVVVAGYSRAPTRALCPECEGPTQVVLLPPVLRKNRFVHMRWCPGCSWEGLGRNGPEWIRGRRLAHRSGFHWGRARFRSDFGFQFRPQVPSSTLPPHHPSGFRFGEHLEAEEADHPSGFRFAEADEAPSDRPVFRWRRSATAEDFTFGKREDPNGPGGFTWKGVA